MAPLRRNKIAPDEAWLMGLPQCLSEELGQAELLFHKSLKEFLPAWKESIKISAKIWEPQGMLWFTAECGDPASFSSLLQYPSGFSRSVGSPGDGM